MFTEKEINLFKTVCEMNGISGHEKNIARYLKEQYIKYGCEIIYDNLGSIYGLKKSKVKDAPRVVLDAHMDEIGFVVSEVLPNGCIKVLPVGGINPVHLTSARLILTKRNGEEIEGTFDYLKHDVENIETYLADFGFTSREDAFNNDVHIGDMIVMKGDLVVLNGGKRLLAKAFDDRYGIVLGLEMLEHFQNVDLPFDLYVGGAVQEEVGLRGAMAISNLIKPDFAICLDCSPARELDNEVGRLGDGLLLRYFDRSMVAFEELIMLQEEACKRANVKAQYFDSKGGTNAGVYHTSNTGVLTLTHCICARNLHCPSTIIDGDDYHAAKLSLIEILKMLNKDKIEELKACRRL